MVSLGPFYHNNIYPGSPYDDCTVAKYSCLKYAGMDLDITVGWVQGPTKPYHEPIYPLTSRSPLSETSTLNLE